MKAVIYARYSSDNQREESIEGQIRECTDYARYNDMTIVGKYIDRAMTAKSDNRPNFQKMIKDSSKKLFDIVIVWKLDRFARNRYDSAIYKSKLKKNGVRVVSAKESISAGAEGIILESVLEGYAEYYSVDLAEKVNRGMTENALKCLNNGSVVPMGYIVDDEQHLQLDEAKVPFVVEIFNRFADGDSIKNILTDMNNRGVGIRIHGKKSKTKKTVDRPLNYNIIRRMLSNRKYIGEYKFKDVVVPNGVPQIIDEEVFKKVQTRLESNKKAPAKHKAEDDYLLTTKLFCGKCKAMMVGDCGTSKNNKTYRYYKCVNTKKRHTCDKKAVKKDYIENAVCKAIMEKIVDNDFMEQLSYSLHDLLMQDNTLIPALQLKLDEVNEKIENMLTAIESGVLLPSTKERLAKLEKQKQDLEIEITEEQIRTPILTQEQILYALTLFRNLDISTREGKERLINGFVNSIFLFDDRIVITCNYKNNESVITLEEIEDSGLLDTPKTSKTAKEKPETQKCSDLFLFGDPYEIRTRVTAVKGRCLNRLTKGPLIY